MDNGLEFNNAPLKELLKLYKIQVHYTTLQNPNSNALVERLHSTLGILKNQKVGQDVKQLMKLAILAYNSTNHTATEYIQRHKERTKCLSDSIAKKMQGKKEQTIGRRNEQRKDKRLAIGQEVSIAKKMQGKKEQTIGFRFTQVIIHMY
ncbi:hypothetical protein QE152_g9012 [Popillia japonica]|uniref:Integrase catalytic domain-containing protein n=1 Tax=Popillia japonica TaxID=7064 RepID=A0AAW1M0K8_POPJA